MIDSKVPQIGTQLTVDHLRYMIGTVAEQKETLTKLLQDCSVGDLVIVLAYVMAAISNQVPAALETFLETESILFISYSNLLKEYRLAHPEDTNNFTFVVPDNITKPDKNPFLESSESGVVILPETGSVN